jgi:hypothetical protein
MLFGRKLFNKRMFKLFSENLKSKHVNVTLLPQATGDIYLPAAERYCQCARLELASRASLLGEALRKQTASCKIFIPLLTYHTVNHTESDRLKV